MLTMTWRHGVLLGALPLCGCAQDNLTTPPPDGVRILVTTRSESMSVGLVTTQAHNLARVPVSDVVEVGPNRYRMTLVCPDEASCRDAVGRVRGDRSFALGVDIDPRQQIPAKPTREMSR
jgi:hypothetical protein